MDSSFQDADNSVTPHPFAGFWTRFVALILDSFLISVSTLLLFAIFHIPLMPAPDDYSSQLYGQLVNIIVGWLYYASFESSRYQATPGKQLMGIFVTDEAGNRISFLRATGRFFAKLLSGLILLLGYVMAAYTERRQALHDKLAGTLVYKH
ncbi:RDD family protein [Pontibacter chitinilyticus]|uniref:RDD family protein n=1 Tax=Pontibacter chitinilyticus TaxID=2674989 RepID=UPI003218F9AD